MFYVVQELLLKIVIMGEKGEFGKPIIYIYILILVIQQINVISLLKWRIKIKLKAKRNEMK